MDMHQFRIMLSAIARKEGGRDIVGGQVPLEMSGMTSDVNCFQRRITGGKSTSLVWNRKVHRRVDKSPPLIPKPELGESNPHPRTLFIYD
jgi:hypothetical protein